MLTAELLLHTPNQPDPAAIQDEIIKLDRLVDEAAAAGQTKRADALGAAMQALLWARSGDNHFSAPSAG